MEEVVLEEIIKQEEDGLWYVYSRDGKKKLSKGYKTEEEAKKRLAQIEFFKHLKEEELPVSEDYPNEHAARVRDPGDFQPDSFRRKELPNGVVMILGKLKGEKTMTAQAYRFPKDKFTAAEAKKWLEEHDIEYKEFEPARKEEKASEVATDVVAVVPSGVTSFAELLAIEKTEKLVRDVQARMTQFQQIITNILYSDIPDKVAAIISLASELADLLPALKGGEEESMWSEEAATVRARVLAASKALDELTKEKALPDGIRSQIMALRASFKRTWRDLEAEATEEEPLGEREKIAESLTDFAIINSGEAGAEPVSSALDMDVVIIRPGWGNARDNHYYPREMLSQYADRFVGAKMYETDHRPSEKSTRTWVSTITSITGFTDEGAPIARVTVHDPNFAARIRNLDKKGLLNKLECSILADAVAEKGTYEEGGRKGKRILSIASVDSVDWVTKAGAGGHALRVAENDDDKEGGKVYMMTQEEVKSVVEATQLPEVSKVRLMEVEYADRSTLDAAIAREVEYVKQLTGAGKPVAQGSSQSATAHPMMTEQEYAERYQKIIESHGLTNK